MIKPNILYEDKYLIVVEKPAGLLSYPIPGKEEQTVGELVGALPVHRLDRDTSGILILAKDAESKSRLQSLFSDREITKEYLTLVWGELEPKRGEINIPLGRGAKDRLRVVPSGSGRASQTLYEVKNYFSESGMSLLSVGLMTGRTHQIRVHMSAIGHPVVGDPKYSKHKVGLSRQFLHAAHIKFIHPMTGETIDLKSELPSDLADFLSALR